MVKERIAQNERIQQVPVDLGMLGPIDTSDSFPSAPFLTSGRDFTAKMSTQFIFQGLLNKIFPSFNSLNWQVFEKEQN